MISILTIKETFVLSGCISHTIFRDRGDTGITTFIFCGFFFVTEKLSDIFNFNYVYLNFLWNLCMPQCLL